MNFNQAPYFDDFDDKSSYYKILFRPGVAVQTREVNQLQSILQNQITKFGNHVFREGSMVIPGQINYNDNLAFVKLSSTSLGDNTQDSLDVLINQVISNNEDGTGVRAKVVAVRAATSTDPITLVVLYIGKDEGLAGTGSQAFNANDTLYVQDGSAATLTVQGGDNVTGRAAVAAMQAGVYYLAGYFVYVPESTLIVEKFVNNITDINYKIGLQYTERFVTEDTDSALYDNAAGSPNFAAPGAHRYEITTELISVGLDETPEKFFELLRLESGVVQNQINASQYNILEETLARRTYDESGNYVIDNFELDVKESRSNNRGAWKANTAYLVGDYVQSNGQYFTCIYSGTSGETAPADFSTIYTANTPPKRIVDSTTNWRYESNPVNNNGAFTPENGGSNNNLVLNFGIGKAYIRGFEIAKNGISQITIPKSRETISSVTTTINTPVGNYIYLDRTRSYGLPHLSTGSTVTFYDRHIGQNQANAPKIGYGFKVGQARITFMDADVIGAYKLGLMDIKMEPGKTLDQNVNMVVVDAAGSTNYTTSYVLTGAIRYAGAGAETTSVVASGSFSVGAGLSGSAIAITSTATSAFTREFVVGDTIRLGSTASIAYTVVSITNDTTMTVSLATGNTGSGTSAANCLLTLPEYTVFGLGTSTATRFLTELRNGDTVTLSSASIVGTVRNVVSDNRFIVSSTTTTPIAWSSTAGVISVRFSGETASFAANVFYSPSLGINTKRLAGSYQILTYTGGTGGIPVRQSMMIQGSTDARLLSELRPADLVNINNNEIFITKVSSNTVAYGISLNGTVTGSNTAYTAYKTQNTLREQSNNGLVFEITNAVSEVKNNEYYVYKTQDVSIAASTSIVVNLSGATEEVATTDPGFYLVSLIDTSSAPVTVSAVSVAGTDVTITVPTALTGTVRVIWPVYRSVSGGLTTGLKTKTLIYDAENTFLTESAAKLSRLQLSKTDIFRVTKILMATSFVASWDTATEASAVDITKNYNLDNGQRSNYYNFGALILNQGSQLPSGSVKVFYDYFEHSAGDFFTYASYNTNAVPLEQIPDYNGKNLRDCIDYRASLGTDGNSVGLKTPRYGTNFDADVAHYLARNDRVLLDFNKTFYTVSSVSAVNPKMPDVDNTDNSSIHLYDISLAAYTNTSEWPDVILKSYDNRRFTMADIGKIEKRVSNLEEITSLSLLESKSRNLQIRDNKDSSLERYKTGIFVDNFTDLSNAAPDSDSRFSVDTIAQTLNPHVSDYSFPLIEKLNFTEDSGVAGQGSEELTPIFAARKAANYRVTGDMLTLDYTTSTVLQQTLATTSISVAPFLSITFLGNLKLTPESDVYTSTENVKVNKADAGNAKRYAEAAALGQKMYGSRYRITEESKTTVSTNVKETEIPYCRANTVLLYATGLQPNTKFYTFVDNIDVRQYVTGAVKLNVFAVSQLNFRHYRAKNKGTKARWRSLATTINRRVGGFWQLSPEFWDARSGRFKLEKELAANPWYATSLRLWQQYTRSGPLVRRTIMPRNYELRLPSEKFLDAPRVALGGGVEVYYNEGSVRQGSGVAVHQDGNTLYVVNARGKLSPTSIRNGNVNLNGALYIGATDKYNSIFNNTLIAANNVLTDDTSGCLYSDDKGVICALLDFPDQDTMRFLRGKKVIALSTSASNDPEDWTSRAEATYTVEGTKITITKTYVTTKSYKARPIPSDPVAQSFKLPEQFTSGAFITDVDVYFQKVPASETLPVSMEIRTCDSTGRPSEEILPGTQVVKFRDEVEVDETSGQIPTKFTFDNPIYLMPEKNYAIVLKSDTIDYRIWIATLGQKDVFNTNKTYSTQATLGSFFKSQDGTLWTEDQFSDMKFKINRAVFVANANSTTYLVNQNLETKPLLLDPLTFMHGSPLIRVTHPNHGLRNGDKIRIHSSYWADQYTADNNVKLYGIPVAEIFSNTLEADDPSDAQLLTVTEAGLDDYVVTTLSSTVAIVGASALTGETTISAGGSDLVVNSNVLYHVATPAMKNMSFQETAMSFQGLTMNGHTYDNLPESTVKYTLTNNNLNVNTVNFFDDPRVILTETNEINRFDGVDIGGVTWKDSFIGVINMSSTNDAVSPAVDLSTTYLNVIQHRIDNPTRANRLGGALPVYGTTSTFIGISTLVSSNTTVSFQASDNSINTTTAGLFDGFIPGSYLTISGSTVSGNNNTSTGVLIEDVSLDGTKIFLSTNAASNTKPGIALTNQIAGDSITLRQLTDFVEEDTTLDASGESKYITRKIALENAATSMKIIVEGNVPSAADFDVYYKLGSANTDFNVLTWTKFSSMPVITKSDIRGNFTDITIDITDFDSSGNVRDLPPFSAFQIKFVMRSTNAARVPQFRNMRVIAHA